MINSGIYTRSTVSLSGQIQQEFDTDSSVPSQINKSSMYHLVSSHIFSIFDDEKLSPLLKQKFIYEFGHRLGFSLAEQECLGFSKHCFPKTQAKKQKADSSKEFVGQMKILNGRIWSALVGNKGKLFAITNNQNIKGVNYKIQDKQFLLGKSTKKPSNTKQKQYHKLLIDFCHGFVKGSLQKFDLSADVICVEGSQGSVYAELKNLTRKSSVSKYNEYTKQFDKQNNFLK